MKNKNAFLTFAIALILALVPAAYGQAVMPHTTLASAITTTNQNTVSLTAVTANGYTLVAGGAFIVDQEAFNVISVTSTTATVTRGYNRTTAATHASGEVVLFGPQNYFYTRQPPIGSCTASNALVLPFVTVNQDSKRVELYNCPNGNWIQQTMTDAVGPSYTRYCAAPLSGFTLLTSFTSTVSYTFGADTTPVSGTVYYGTIEIPKTFRITGISMLNGTVASTDKYIFSLHRADGTVLASTDTAGTLAANAGLFQDIAFSTPFLATGPSRYWISMQTNGNTTRFRSFPVPAGAGTAAFTGLLGSSATGTFGTVPSLTLPTSLIANTAPLACVY